MDLSSSSRSSKRKREAFRMRWRFLEDAGFFALRALGKRPGMIQESKLKFQCLLCPFRSLESLPDSFFSCSHSSISNLKKHVRRIHGHRFAEFQEVMKRRQKSKKGEKQKLIQLDFQISTKSDSDDNDDSDDPQHHNKPAPVAEMTHGPVAPLVKFLEDFGFFSLPSSKKDSSKLIFQCLMCDSKVTFLDSSLANLEKHVQRFHPERSEEFNRETSEIQKRGQVGVVHDDDDDGAVPEEHDRTVQMHSEDQQEASAGYPWDFLFQDFFRLSWSAGPIDDRNSQLRFRCLLCDPESATVSCNRSSLSNLKRHVWRKHQSAFEKLDALWKSNLKGIGKQNPEAGDRMYDSDNDDGNAYDNDDDAEEDALFSSNVFQPQVTLKEEYVEMDSARYPWNFLETAGYYTLIGSTLLDVNDQQSTLRFQCLLCNPSAGTMVSCSGGSLSNLKRHVLKVHPQSYEDLENLWRISMKDFLPASLSRPRHRDATENVESD